MQERYIGDCHDYVKYALLWHLKECGFKLGINWYLADTEGVGDKGKGDGQNRHYLKDKHAPKWRRLNPTLFAKMKKLQGDEKSLEDICAHGILPKGTHEFKEHVCGVKKDGSFCRRKWHAEALETLKPADLIFLDPDNGLEVKSMTNKKRPKYVHTGLFSRRDRTCNEIQGYLKKGKIVVCIQFRRQGIKLDEQIRNQYRKLIEDGCVGKSLPVIGRGRVGGTGHIMFYSFAPSKNHAKMAKVLSAFAKSSKGLLGTH